MVVQRLESHEAYVAAIEESKSKLVVISFSAIWSGPSRIVDPLVEKLSELPKFQDKVGFYKLDVDELHQAAADSGVTAIPTFQLFTDGEAVRQVRGTNPQDLQNAIEKFV